MNNLTQTTGRLTTQTAQKYFSTAQQAPAFFRQLPNVKPIMDAFSKIGVTQAEEIGSEGKTVDDLAQALGTTLDKLGEQMGKCPMGGGASLPAIGQE